MKTASFLLLASWLIVMISPPLHAQEAAPVLSITVDNKGWEKASPADIKAVVSSAGNEIWKHCPATRLDPIFVHFRSDHPQTNFKRDGQNRIVIGLASGNNLWSQFAFQFAHEFGHALAAQSNDVTRLWHNAQHANMWLEESLCETASLFALRRMGETWKTKPPYPNWKSYGASLLDYAQKRMDDPKHQLPEGVNFQGWFRLQQPIMRENPTLREKNCVVAAQLLPLFEAEPSGWESLTYLNLGPRDEKKTLAQQLADWNENCPAKHKPFVSKIAALFSSSP